MPTEQEIEAVMEVYFESPGDPYATAKRALEAAEHVRGDGWMPIESAPRDGTPFWAFEASKAEPQYVCWWKEDYGGWEGWQDVSDSEPEPTHFRHLPPPPKASEEVG